MGIYIKGQQKKQNGKEFISVFIELWIKFF